VEMHNGVRNSTNMNNNKDKQFNRKKMSAK